jgi:hypothetical protein
MKSKLSWEDQQKKLDDQKQLADHLEYLASRRPVIRKFAIDGNVVLNIYETPRDARVSVSQKSADLINDCIAGVVDSAHGFKWDAVYVDQNNNKIP